MRPDVEFFRGIWSAHKRLADGSKRIHYYAWKGGPKLPGQDRYAPDFIKALMEARASRAQAPAEVKTLAWLIREYRASTLFTTKRERTRDDYSKWHTQVEARFGDLPLHALADTRTSDMFYAWRDELVAEARKRGADGLRQADLAWSTLQAVISFGMKRKKEFVRHNPCDGADRLYQGSRAEIIWSTQQVAAFVAQRRFAHMHIPLMIALWTGLHQGDICTIPFSAYDGEFIRWKQAKSIGSKRRPKYLAIPVAGPLREWLDRERDEREAALRASPVRPLDIDAAVAAQAIVLNSDGEPWRRGKKGFNGFRSTFAKARAEAGVTGVAFTDLRGTAVTRLKMAGCEVTRICEITGHTSAEVNGILERHYMARDPAGALEAIRRLEVRFGAADWPAAVGAKGSAKGSAKVEGTKRGATAAAAAPETLPAHIPADARRRPGRGSTGTLTKRGKLRLAARVGA
jgi:hypothetical protein